jgi:hypothetical protein
MIDMKLLAAMMLLASLFGGSLGCSQDQAANGESTIVGDANASNQCGIHAANNPKSKKMKIKIGSKTFSATLFDSATATAFKAMLPLTLEMDELNGNEKKHDFSKSLPTDSFNPKTINNGDLMLWGSHTLVLFYKSFPTQYPYTKLGRIDDPSGLAAAVGSGDVTVTFEAE